MIQMTKEKVERFEKNARFLGYCNVLTHSGNRYTGDVIVTRNYYIVHDIVHGTKTVLDKDTVRIVELSQLEDQFS